VKRRRFKHAPKASASEATPSACATTASVERWHGDGRCRLWVCAVAHLENVHQRLRAETFETFERACHARKASRAHPRACSRKLLDRADRI